MLVIFAAILKDNVYCLGHWIFLTDEDDPIDSIEMDCLINCSSYLQNPRGTSLAFMERYCSFKGYRVIASPVKIIN